MKEAGHSFVRIDGSVCAANRISAISRFDSDAADAPRFILCSLLASGTGINLTRANWCFMMDVWWNDAVESQAMDRSKYSIFLTSFIHGYRSLWTISLLFSSSHFPNSQGSRSAIRHEELYWGTHYQGPGEEKSPSKECCPKVERRWKEKGATWRSTRTSWYRWSLGLYLLWTNVTMQLNQGGILMSLHLIVII